MTLEPKHQDANRHLRVLSALHRCTHGDAGPGEIRARNGLPCHDVVWPMVESGGGSGSGGCNEDGTVILAGHAAEAERSAVGIDRWDNKEEGTLPRRPAEEKHHLHCHHSTDVQVGVTVHHKHLHLPCRHGHSGIPAPSAVCDGVVFICHYINKVSVCLQRVGWHHVVPPPCCHWEELLHHKVKASRHPDTGVATEDGHRGVGHHNCASEVLAALELQAVVRLQEQAEHGTRDVGGPSIVESGGGGDADSGGGGTGGHHKLGQAISAVPKGCHHVIPGAQTLHRQEGSGTHGVTLGADGHHGDVRAGLDHQGFMGSAASSEFQVSGEGQGQSDIRPQGDILGDGAATKRH